MIYLVALTIMFSGYVSCAKVTILHTGNMFSQFEPSIYGNRSIGGFGRVATYLRRHKNQKHIYIDAGDVFTGSDWFALMNGEIWNEMWLRALDGVQKVRTFGEQELLYGLDPLLQYLRNTKRETMICCNCRPNVRQLAGTFRTHMLYYNKTIGLTGLMCDTKEMTTFQKLIYLEDPFSSLRETIVMLKSETKHKMKLLIVVSHCGYAADIELARRSMAVGIIVGAHTGTFLYTGYPGSALVDQKPQGEYPTAIPNIDRKLVYIVHASHSAKYVGKLHVVYGHQVIYSCRGNPILMDRTIPENKKVQEILEHNRPDLEKFQNVEVGMSHIVLDGYEDKCKIRECNLGNLVTDAMANKIANLSGTNRRWSVSGISIINGGAIATGIIPQSMRTTTIRYIDLRKALPFYNCIHILRVTGENLVKALEHSVSDTSFPRSDNVRPQFLQVSGIRVVYDLNKLSGKRVIAVKVRCGYCVNPIYEDIDYSRKYSVGMTDYLAMKGNGYTMFDIRTAHDHLYSKTRLDLLETVSEFMTRQKFVEPTPQERIVLMHGKSGSRGKVIRFFSVSYLFVVCVIVL